MLYTIINISYKQYLFENIVIGYDVEDIGRMKSKGTQKQKNTTILMYEWSIYAVLSLTDFLSPSILHQIRAAGLSLTKYAAWRHLN